MGYLICQNCGGYYKLKEGESSEDFVACECYGPLVYVENLDGLRKRKHDEVKSDALKELKKKSHDGKTEVKSELSPKKEPLVKNRAYYRRYYYYSEPNVTQLKQNKDVTGLVNALYYDDQKIRQEAAQALAAVGDERALEHLDKVIKEENGSLKLYAEIAVNQIKSKKHGFKSRNRENYRNNIHKSINVTTEVSEPVHETGLIKIKEERKTKPLRISSPDESTDPNKSLKSSLTKGESNLTIHEDHLLPSTGVEVSEGEVFEGEVSEGEVFEGEVFEGEVSGGEVSGGEVSGGEVSGGEVSEGEVSEGEVSEGKLSEGEISEGKKSEESQNISDPLMFKDSQVIKSGSESPEVQSGVKLDEVETPEIGSSNKEVEITGTSEVKPKETKESQIRSLETKPEITGITTGTVESSNISKQDNSDENTTFTMKTVDDTEFTPLGNDKKTDTKQTSSLNNSKPMKVHTSKLSKTSTPPDTPKKGKSRNSSPAAVQNKIKTKNEKMGQETPKKDENMYFIKWLGIKNSDKPLISMIVLLMVALIVGVILTMSSK
ncbi:HEAT repeat domain-containing protein [Methanobacterium petrolearium]|uniref:HEAT repeat domain-containing protein n=1 Tax=Methanobacterium petrolearium TaxID=710190 RepID=UPI001AEA592E|nr:HEAT repeat domain-containing protein [Methanobacterium petrolearium]MBP1945317.1 hypothetical protein [Methanobacterium petrolearium]BDZ71499.1 hypothetical protein GCM10025861_20160 [Methanobacterium petrolearium]